MPRSRLSKISRTRPRNTSRRLRQPSIYSRTDEVKEKRSHKGLFRALFFVIVLIGLFYLVFFSGVFSVDSIEYSPTEYIDRGALEKTVKDGRIPFLDDNILTFGTFGFASRVEKVTGIYKVNVKRVSQHKVRIEIVEKAPLLVWQTLDRKYLLDSDGVIWANFEEKYASLPILIDTKNLPVKISDKVLPQSFVQFFQELVTNFGDIGAKPVKYEIMDIISDLKVTTDAGWYVYFDTTRTAKNELISLKRVLTEVKNGKTKLEYVDLRINNRIFYK